MISDYSAIRIGDRKLFRIGIGTGAHASSFTWGVQQREESLAAVREAVDLGISLIDTGETYGKGACETIVGEAIRGNREKAFVATKISEAVLETNQKSAIEAACDQSLFRLGTDYIDLYQIHWLNDRIDTDLAAESLLELKEKGKVRNLGICNCGKNYTKKFGDEFVTMQSPYSLIWRGMEYEFGEHLEHTGKTALFYYCLGQGLLGKKYDDIRLFPESRKRTRLFDSSTLHARHGEAGQEQVLSRLLRNFHELCDSYQIDEAYAAIGWILNNVGDSLAVIGMRSIEQVKFFAGLVTIPDSFYLELSEVSEELKRCNGRKLDLWDSKERIR